MKPQNYYKTSTLMYYCDDWYVNQIERVISSFGYTNISINFKEEPKSNIGRDDSNSDFVTKIRKWVISFDTRKTKAPNFRKDEFLDYNEGCMLVDIVCHIIQNNALILSDDRSFLGIYKDNSVRIITYNHDRYGHERGLV